MRVWVCAWEPLDRVCLWSLEREQQTERPLLTGGEVCFGHLPPGAYGLALCRGGRRTALVLRLPPGSNVELWLDGAGGGRWRRDGWHYRHNLR